MRARTKLTLAAGLVGAMAMAAAAFGQVGSSALTPGGTPAPGRAARDPDTCGPRRAHPRLARLVHSESKVKAREGFAFVVVDQGEVTAVDHEARTLTVKRLDGETVRATATDQTRICKDGHRASFDEVQVGDLARLVQVRSAERNGLVRIRLRSRAQAETAPGRVPEGTVFEGGALDDADLI